jgi:choline dehydrogenase-like flavoprotein
MHLVLRDLGVDLAQKNRFLGWGFEAVRPVIKLHLNRLFSRSLIFASITEDLPYEDNCVSVRAIDQEGVDSKLLIDYKIHNHEMKRLKELRAKLRSVFSPYPVTFVEHASSNKTLAHACGTCRFGDDPGNTVLNRYNRSHDLDNLYVADSSFFPSSGGTNPGLTLAANSLRVADHLLKGSGQG